LSSHADRIVQAHEGADGALNIRYSKYLDATGLHRLRGPEDLARYAALVTGADLAFLRSL
jgi:hypothetical protein